MTTKTITLTIAELCARLGKEYFEGTTRIRKDGSLCLEKIGKDGLYDRASVIRSINDKIELDECERCGSKLSSHINNTSSRRRDNGDYCSKGFPLKDTEIKPSNRFKPRLAIIQDIKLVERCECGHDASFHDLIKGVKCSCGWQFGNEPKEGCKCRQYKPVQTVEITYEEAR